MKANLWTLIKQSASAFVSRLTVLFLLYIVLRFFEMVYNVVLHGYDHYFFMVLLYGLVKDFSFIVMITLPLYLLYTILYLLNKKIANIVFIIIAALLCVIQIALVKYFLTSLVPLGGDLWQYSWSDIKQTVGAAGGIPLSAIIIFLAFIALVVFLFSFLTKRINFKAGISIFIIILFILADRLGISSIVTEWKPTNNEYANNLSLDKCAFFYNSSMERFLPKSQDLDIYSDAYNGDYGDEKGNNETISIKYVDENNYPFLHKDETPDVLSAFFHPAPAKPNIVVLLVEGLGRAFTNDGAYLGNFTPFIDSLSQKSLYWENFMSEGGRTFAVLPSVFGSLPFGKNGFCEFGEKAPNDVSLISLLRYNGYNTAFYYGGDSHFDLMDVFLKKNEINQINDINTFPAGYVKLPGNQGGFSWGYGDKELFRRYFETKESPTQPYLSILLTVSTHSPFLINEQDYYLNRFEKRMTELNFSDSRKASLRDYKYQLASVLYTDDAIRQFFNVYSKRPDFNNTIFIITGDHRMPEIPMINKIDRYHVPLIVYSPLAYRKARFSSISTHFDITPSLLAFLKNQYHLQAPSLVSWLGTGLDTAREFRNVHSYPIMQTKNDIVDFISGSYMINVKDLYSIDPQLNLNALNDNQVSNRLSGLFDKFKQKNNKIIDGGKLIPDSIYTHYFPK